MDPNAALREMRRAIAAIRDIQDSDVGPHWFDGVWYSAQIADEAVALVDAAEALDNWMRRGGFPADWSK